MAVIDFREIPSARGGTEQSDTWELFARDFFSALGLVVELGPGRGADSGRDLMVIEEYRGEMTTRRLRWVVSCKHYAQSGNAISDRDEPDPLGRVRKFGAEGFIGFSSTLPSSSLNDTFDRLRDQMATKLYDGASIEAVLLGDGRLRPVFRRHFPESFKRWQREGREPVEVWKGYDPLSCAVCDKDLLTQPRSSMVGFAFAPVDCADDRRQETGL